MVLFRDGEENIAVESEVKGVLEAAEETADIVNPMSDDVDGMLGELDELEKLLEKKEAPLPIIPPPVKHVDVPSEPLPKVTKATFAKLDDEQLDAIMRKINKIDALEQEVTYLREVIDDRLNVDFQAMYHNIMEKNNIEAIKTYRNVQAVIVEETAKQNKALVGIDDKSSSLKRRLNNVMFFSIISFVTSVLVMLMIILPALGFDIFK